MTPPDVRHRLDNVARRLSRRFDRVEPEAVRQCVEESYAALAEGARTTTFLPVLAERAARDRLQTKGR